MGIHWSHGEGLQGQWYEVGEEFKQHFDYDSGPSKALEDIGQRTWTFMLFLNDVEEGGHGHSMCRLRVGLARVM